MKIYRKSRNYSLIGTENRNTRVSNSLLKSLANPVILASPDRTWAHPDKSHRNSVILSDGNSKVSKLGKMIGCKSVSYGKSTILSCPNATGCIRFCYQNLNNYTGSLRLHGHNYLMVYAQSRIEISGKISNAISKLSKSVKIVRLNDNGDFISRQEILAWVDNAVNNPGIVFYGYTKNTPHLYKARQEFGQFPSNLRITISDLSVNDATMEKYMRLILSEFPGEFRVCHIIDSPERDLLYQDLPWNNNEMEAYNYTSDFKIALHVGVAQRQFCNDAELQVNDKYSDGENSNGIRYC